MTQTVAILGGGVAGLTAAHELAERGFAVTVYEARDRLGGKARSLPVPGSGSDGRRDLPAEHGFRFFPGFYRHVPDTMRRIGVDGHLVGADRILLAQGEGRNELLTVAHLPESHADLKVLVRFLHQVGTGLGVPPRDTAWFLDRLLTLLTSCDERRLGQWELQSWWTYIDADHRSQAFQKFLADGLTRTLVAARAREMSARTGGSILLQLIQDLTSPKGQADRVLNGPTSDVWIDPWLDELRRLGVDYRVGCRVDAISSRGARVTGVRVQPVDESFAPAGSSFDATADHYIAAVPVEVLRDAIAMDPLKQASPVLAGLARLQVRWMNGIMYYLTRDAPLIHGHTIFIDSAWALTSISQRQFWPRFNPHDMGDGNVGGILSVDISDWDTKGEYSAKGKIAKACTKEEIA